MLTYGSMKSAFLLVSRTDLIRSSSETMVLPAEARKWTEICARVKQPVSNRTWSRKDEISFSCKDTENIRSPKTGSKVWAHHWHLPWLNNRLANRRDGRYRRADNKRQSRAGGEVHRSAWEDSLDRHRCIINEDDSLSVRYQERVHE